MRESIALDSNMAYIDCIKTDHSKEKNGINKRNWKSTLHYLLKIRSSTSRFTRRRKRSYRPTVDEVSQWAQSFDQLLSHKYGNIAFQIFQKSEFCEENLEFWFACEEFRTMTSPAKLALKAQSMYEEFIKNEAPKEIILDFYTKEAIIQSLHQPTLTSFLEAQKRVYSLMENNSYPRFLSSELFKELCVSAMGREEYPAYRIIPNN